MDVTRHIHGFTIQVILILKYDAIPYVLIPLPENTSHIKCKLSSQLTRNYNSHEAMSNITVKHNIALTHITSPLLTYHT